MKSATIAGGTFVTVLVLLVLADTYRALEPGRRPRAAATSPAITPSTTSRRRPTQGFLYGRVTTDGGATYEGRLRFGGDEEAFWGNYFNGVKDENPWAAHVPPERLPRAPPDRDLRVRNRPTGSVRSTSAGHSWRASATSRASRRAAATCG